MFHLKRSGWIKEGCPMLSYIANIDTAQLIQKVCKRKNILILNTQEFETITVTHCTNAL